MCVNGGGGGGGGGAERGLVDQSDSSNWKDLHCNASSVEFVRDHENRADMWISSLGTTCNNLILRESPTGFQKQIAAWKERFESEPHRRDSRAKSAPNGRRQAQ